MSTTDKTNGPVCYLRVSAYFQEYLKIKYGGFPIRFPEVHPASVILETRISQNPSLKALDINGYCSAAFNYKRVGKVFDIEIGTPAPDEREEFIPICLPESVQRFGGMVRTSDNWQLTQKGSKQLRKIIKREFWTDCLLFVDECFARARVTGENVTKEDAVADFMTIYEIPMEHYENMITYERRERKNIGRDIEDKRDRLEEQSTNRFFYT